MYLLSPWLDCRSLGYTEPRLNLVPIEPKTRVQARSPKTNFDHNGITWRLTDKPIVRTMEGPNMTFLKVGDAIVIVNNPAHDEGWVVSQLVRDDKVAASLLGGETLHSNYRLMLAAMSATPDQAKWWRLRSKENRKTELLLVTKFSALTGGLSSQIFSISPIFSIDTGNVHGFQFGDPDAPPYDTHLDLFDDADRHISFDLTGLQGHGKLFTQQDINAMVSSIRLSSGSAAAQPTNQSPVTKDSTE